MFATYGALIGLAIAIILIIRRSHTGRVCAIRKFAGYRLFYYDSRVQYGVLAIMTGESQAARKELRCVR